MSYTIIRNIRGNWPNWTADLDDGRKVFIYIRYGEIWIGVGDSENAAQKAVKGVPNLWGLNGVSDCVDALVALRKYGYYFVCSVHGR